jgi:hypothetical protein
MMPLTTTFAELDEGMDILEAAMAEEFGAEAEEPFQSLCDWLVSLEAA